MTRTTRVRTSRRPANAIRRREPNPDPDLDTYLDPLFAPEVERGLAVQRATAATPARPRAASVTRGLPGQSLREVYTRRENQRAADTRRAHPLLGGLILAFTDTPQSTKAFATGARGEEKVAAQLEKSCGDQALFLHNRALGPNRRDGDIDHLVIAASGVYVVDTKNYANATVEVRRGRGLRTDASEHLLIRGRDHTVLLGSVTRQRCAVTDAIRDAAAAVGIVPNAVPVYPVLCFLDADIRGRGVQYITDIAVVSLRGAMKLIGRRGPIDADTRRALQQQLAELLPAA
jgi:hypothetical protein